MASKYSEYSRLRSIARKRAERLSEAGLSKLITFPSVKELKAQGVSPAQAVKQVERYLKAPTQTRQYRRMDEQQRPVFIQEDSEIIVAEKGKEQEARRKAQNRRASQKYRERKYYERIKKEYPELTKSELALIKAGRRLGLNIPLSKIRSYIEYIEYRFSFGSSKLKYRISTYVEDYEAITAKKKYTNKDFMNDFHLFMKDQKELVIAERKSKKRIKKKDVNEYGYTGEEVEKLFSDFIN